MIGTTKTSAARRNSTYVPVKRQRNPVTGDQKVAVIRQVFSRKLGLSPNASDFEAILSRDNAGDTEACCIEYLKDHKIREVCDDIYRRLLSRSVDDESLAFYEASFLSERLKVSQLERSVELSEERNRTLTPFVHISLLKSTTVDEDAIRNFRVSDELKGISIRYIGPVGRTGYSQAAKSYLYALFVCGADLAFYAIQNHFFSRPSGEPSPKDMVLAYHYERQLEGDPDIVIVHSVPDMWPKVVEYERSKFPLAKIVGITVWESDRVHPAWVPMMNLVDLIMTPCEWNMASFSRDVEVPVFTVHTPCDGMAEPSKNFRLSSRCEGKRVFYSINEWTSRKGNEDLISSFVDTFTAKDDVILYIKTSGISAAACNRYVSEVCHGYDSPPEVIVETRDISDGEISAIHRLGHVCCSFTRAEGTGLGCLEAITRGNPVIIGGYGGQMDYLKGAFFISCHEEKPFMCNPRQGGHGMCRSGVCRLYPWYLPTQRWGHPVKDDGKRIMRFVHENYDLCRESCKVAALYAEKHFNSPYIGRKMAKILKDVIGFEKFDYISDIDG